jgi:glutamate-5-semialdehyde dehydrogenase
MPDPAIQVALRGQDVSGSLTPSLGHSPSLELHCVQSPQEALEAMNQAGPRALDAIATADWSVARRFEHESQAVCVSINTVPALEGVDELPAGFNLGLVTRGRHVRGPIGLHALTTARVVVRR